MIVVVSVSKVPAQLRGYLTRWLFEIDRGTYVGQVSARVADALWKAIEINVDQGRAVMVKTTNNEQGFNILAHHQKWVVKDMDGLQVINHPLEDEPAAWRDKTGWSKNAKRLRHKRYTKGYAIKENDSDNRSESH